MVGDGGFLSVLGALATAVELNVPVLWLLFNNYCFSTIRTVGSTYFKNTYGTEFTRPDDTETLHAAGAILRNQECPGHRTGGSRSRADRGDRGQRAGPLEVRTRGDVPMPRTGHWDIANFLAGGND